MPDIDVTVVREKNGGIRCIYIGRIRVIGQKPYVSENLRQQVYPVPMKSIEDALALARNEAIEDEYENGPATAPAALNDGEREQQ